MVMGLCLVSHVLRQRRTVPGVYDGCVVVLDFTCFMARQKTVLGVWSGHDSCGCALSYKSQVRGV